jgi:predicted XRE-type DNA-binding protein
MKTPIGTTITKSSGSVFADLGFSPVEARNLRLRSQMMTALRNFIEKENWHKPRPRRLRVSQPRISDLTRGRISRFSLDTLVNKLADAGLEVDFRIKAPSRRVARPNGGQRFHHFPGGDSDAYSSDHAGAVGVGRVV